jgi:oligoribonuclease
MHQENGLVDACAVTPHTLVQVDAELARHLAHWGKEHEYMLAGSGVGHFDRRFIRQQLPAVDAFLQYPAIDVGVIRRAMRMWAGDALDFKMNEGKEHRAMADIEQHLAEALTYRSLFRQWGRTESATPGGPPITDFRG